MSRSFHLAHADIGRSRFELLFEHGASGEAFTLRGRFEVST
jgi:hypothetical protein